MKICVFLGSNNGLNPIYRAGTIALGERLVKEKATLVYGGGKVGLMGTLATTVTDGGQAVIGIIPTFLKEKGLLFEHLTEVIEVSDMASRKDKMMSVADAFIVLPGGLGTLEEAFDMLSWSQLGLHKKPIAFLNLADFFTPLQNLFGQVVQAGFAPAENQNLLTISEDIDDIFNFIQNFKYRPANKYLN